MPNQRPSRALAFWERITEAPDPREFIKNLVRPENTAECDFIDFKSGKASDRDVQKIWSKSLCCFANSDGGIIIWGINAPQTGPRTLDPAEDVHRLAVRLNQLTPVTTEAPVQGVFITPFPDPDRAQPNRGYVACYIPESPWKPHKAIHAEHPFYIRSGDNCVPMAMSVLRSLFNPQSIAFLKLRSRIEFKMGAQGSHDVTLRVWVENVGPSTAYDVFIHYSLPTGMPPSDINKIWNRTETGFRGKALLAERPIHPTEIVPLFSVLLGKVHKNQPVLKIGPKGECYLHFGCFTKDQSPLKYRVTISDQDIVDGKILTPEPTS